MASFVRCDWPRASLWVALALGLMASIFGLDAPSRASTDGVDCHRITVSPTYKLDKTLYCFSNLSSLEDGDWKVGLQISKDAGRSWEPMPSEGLDSGDKSNAVDLLALPRETTDSDFGYENVLYIRLVHGTDRGLYVSENDGETWTLADKLLGEPLIRELNAYVDPVLAATGWIIYPGAVPGRLAPPFHVPVAGSPDLDEFFVFPPGYPSNGTVLVLGSRDTEPDGLVFHSEFSVYRCDQDLTCADKTYTFPDKTFVYGDYINDRAAYFSGRDTGDPTAAEGGGQEDLRPARVWWTKDGGRTITAWKSVNRLLGTDPGRSRAEVVESERYPGRYFMLLDKSTGNQLFRSDDAGRSWRRLSDHDLQDTMSGLVALPDGRLLVTAHRLNEPQRAYCSVDQGRTWATRCQG